MAVKYIFVTGGVVSGLGKGITAASLGRLLKQRGLHVKVQKLDPYLNVDPGTMSPYQHGEVFVTDDGAETDLDLGHYERFIDESLDVNSSVSSGKVYWDVLNRERRGDYLGADLLPGHPRHRRGHCGDRRHRGGHRVPALSGVHPPGGGGAGAAQRHVHPRLPHRIHPRHRGAEEQAHPALRQGAAEPGHPARRDHVPQRQAHPPGHPGEDLPVLQHSRGERRICSTRCP